MAKERCEKHQYQTLDSQGECPICKQLLTPEEQNKHFYPPKVGWQRPVWHIDELLEAQIAKVCPKFQSMYKEGITPLLKDASEVTAILPETKEAVCPECEGTGKPGMYERIKGEIVYTDWICKACQGTGKRARPDREKIAEWLKGKITNLAVGMMIIVGKLKIEDLNETDKARFEEICQLTFDQIIALIPDEAEIRKQLKLADRNYVELKNAFDERIEEARKQERARIRGIINDLNSRDYPYGADYKDAILQALT